ncbi:MAG: hypothetical protein ACOCV8_00280 [Spirochaetota bacterium]
MKKRQLNRIIITIITILGIFTIFFLSLFFCNQYFHYINKENFISKYSPKVNYYPDDYLNLKDIDYTYYYKAPAEYSSNAESKAVKITSVEDFERDSYEFNTFIIKYPYNNVVFKNEEYWTSVYNKNSKIWKDDSLDDSTDEYMTARTAEKVNEVQKELSKINNRFILRITDAYDNNYEHRTRGFRSLHYTGRAVDLTVYDTIKSEVRKDLLPLLYKLSRDAGFDYIYYHRNTHHIHASVKPELIENARLIIWKDKLEQEYDKKKIIPMKEGKNGWFYTDYDFSKAIYFFIFITDKYEYAYRAETYLGRSDNIDPKYGYFADPIMIKLSASYKSKIYFNPYFLRYNISSNDNYETLDRSMLNYISYFAKSGGFIGK